MTSVTIHTRNSETLNNMTTTTTNKIMVKVPGTEKHKRVLKTTKKICQ